MAERREDDRLRNLLDEIDSRLRDAERLRSYAAEQQRRGAFYPERRHSDRVLNVSEPDRRHHGR